MSSPIHIAANQINPLLSTGPRTQTGKYPSNMNALRHGLTGRIVVLPTEDMAEFRRFSQSMLESLSTASMAERELAQTIADSQWRINRILSIEDGMLALGHFEDPNKFDAQDPAINSVISQALAFREHSKSFVNLSIYEQRIHRTMEKAHKCLQELQTARKAECKAEITEAIRLRNLNTPNDLPTNPTRNGFVYATAES